MAGMFLTAEKEDALITLIGKKCLKLMMRYRDHVASYGNKRVKQ